MTHNRLKAWIRIASIFLLELTFRLPKFDSSIRRSRNKHIHVALIKLINVYDLADVALVSVW